MPTAKTSKVRKPKPAEQPKRRRLTHEARKSMIFQGAIKYFAEVGFSGGTRELALRTGVKQPLLYRFFPSKEDLVKNVYDAVYLSRWRHNWSRLISDRSMPLRERLIEFYDEYAEIMFQREWIRIFLFSGLKGIDINRQYVAFMEENILKRICEEILARPRSAFGAGYPDHESGTRGVLDLSWRCLLLRRATGGLQDPRSYRRGGVHSTRRRWAVGGISGGCTSDPGR